MSTSHEFTYVKPDEKSYFNGLIALLKLKEEHDLIAVLIGGKCTIQPSSSYSRKRWNALSTTVYFQILAKNLDLASQEIAQRLIPFCDIVMPKDAGFDVTGVEFSPLLAQEETDSVLDHEDKGTSSQERKWDLFICHASEDKDVVARPLAEKLSGKDLKVWYDDSTLTLGDSLRRSIDFGLARSRYGVVILSPSFFKKDWPQRELDGLTAKERNGVKVILPVWHNVDREYVLRYSPILADKLAVSTSEGLEKVVEEILKAVDKTAVMEGRLRPLSSPVGGPDLEKEYADSVLKDIYANGWRPDEAFREVIVMPNSSRLQLKKRDLEKIIDSSTVEIAGYGGGAFPYRRTYPQVKEIHHVDGFGLVDNSAWPHQDWSFNYWYFAESGFFLQRTHLLEDHMQNLPSKSLALEWLNLEIARSLLFARKLQSSVMDYGEARVVFRLHGMKDRRLVNLNVRRSDFLRDYVSSDVDIEVRATVGLETDLVQTGLNMVLEVVWRFGWRQPSEDTIRKDMATLCGGRFPY